jgi:hypothetical protein
MSAMRRILTVTSTVLLFCIGLVHTLRWAGQPALRGWIETQAAVVAPAEGYHDSWFLADPRHAWWCLLMALPLCILALWIRDLFVDQVLSLATEAGHPLKIRESAVSRYLHDCLSALPFIRGARIRSRCAGGALVTRVRVWVSATDKLDSLQETILHQVMNDARLGLGLTKVQEPDVLVEAVRARRRKAKDAGPQAEPAAEGHADGSVSPTPDVGGGSPTP